MTDYTELRALAEAALKHSIQCKHYGSDCIENHIKNDNEIVIGLLDKLERYEAAQMEYRRGSAKRVLFYENEFYPLSNFSAFQVAIWNQRFPTAEHAYHWRKFMHLSDTNAQSYILHAPSAHEAFKFAESFKRGGLLLPTWEAERVGVMRQILNAKASQHEYVKRKLLETGDRELIEDSWRDDFWGWGPNQDGTNMLGKLWMEVRAALNPTEANDEP